MRDVTFVATLTVAGCRQRFFFFVVFVSLVREERLRNWLLLSCCRYARSCVVLSRLDIALAKFSFETTEAALSPSPYYGK